MAITQDVKWSEFPEGGDMQVGDETTGLRAGINYTFSFPGTGIKDVNGNFILQYSSVGVDAVNSVDIINSISGMPPIVQASGLDTNINFSIQPKGTGALLLDDLLWPIGLGISDQIIGVVSPGQLGFLNVADIGVSEIIGTANQVLANGMITPQIGAVTLSLANPTIIGSIVINGNPSGGGSNGMLSSSTSNLYLNSAGIVSSLVDFAILAGNTLRFYNTASSNFVEFEAGTLSGNTTWILPTSDALVAGQPLVSDASGNLSFTTLTVPGGGTGFATTTAYGLIAGGTTATGAFQNAGTGTTGQVYLSGGNAALGNWTNTAGIGSPLTTKGDLYTYSTLNTRLGVGANSTILMAASGQATGLEWTTATYPATTSINQLLYSSANNVIAGLSTADNGVLITSGSGVPSIGSTLPAAVQGNITAVGALASGSLASGFTVVSPALGGTGENNGSSTITIGGNFLMSGAYTFEGVLTGNTDVTFPTSGTLATTGGTVASITGTANEILANGGTSAQTGAVTLTLPASIKITTSILDTNANTQIGFTTTASAVNYINIANSATTNAVSISAAGSDTDISFILSGKNNGTVQSGEIILNGTPAGGFSNGQISSTGSDLYLNAGMSVASLVTFSVLAGNQLEFWNTANTQYVAFKAGTLSASTLWTLPTADGTNGQALVTNGSQVLSFESVSAGIEIIDADSGSATGSTITISGGSTGLTTTGSGATIDLTGTLALGSGGTNHALTASAGGIVWSDSTKLNILSGTATAGQLLLSGNAATPAWSTSTYPTTNAANTLLYASSANTMAALATVTTAVLTTSSGVPTWATTLSGTLGGTGVNNGSSTITIADNVTFAGAYTFTGTLTNTTSVTFPTSGTLVNSAVATLASLAVIGTSASSVEISPSGIIQLGSSSSNTVTLNGATPLRFYNSADNGYAQFSYAGGSNLSWTLPTTDVAGVMQSNGSGALSLSATTPSLTMPHITFNSTSGIIGTTTNDSAAAGSVGEVISSSIVNASAVSLTTATAANVTSIALTKGDWDVYGNVYFNIGGVCTVAEGWISTTSATAPDLSLIAASTSAAPSTGGFTVPFIRISVASTTTVYLSAEATFSTSTATASGNIYARRAR